MLASGSECFHVVPVTIDTTQEFPLPELFVSPRGSGIAAAFVVMPKVAMGEDDDPILREYRIRIARPLPDMKLIAKSPSEKKRAQDPLRLSILSANVRDHAATLRGGLAEHGLGSISLVCLQRPSIRIPSSQSDREESTVRKVSHEVDSREITGGAS